MLLGTSNMYHSQLYNHVKNNIYLPTPKQTAVATHVALYRNGNQVGEWQGLFLIAIAELFTPLVSFYAHCTVFPEFYVFIEWHRVQYECRRELRFRKPRSYFPEI